MIIKKYLVKDINEGLKKIRYELGKGAIIISQRKVRKSGLKGLFSKKVLEITAAVENSADGEKGNKSFKQDNSYYKQKDEDEEFKNSLESIKKLMQDEVLFTQDKAKSMEHKKNDTLQDKILEHNYNAENETPKND